VFIIVVCCSLSRNAASSILTSPKQASLKSVPDGYVSMDVSADSKLRYGVDSFFETECYQLATGINSH